jgi:hypothetical protein
VLWLLSWVPYGIVLGLSGAWLTMSWTVEILLGVIGLALAGTEVIASVKARGWRRAPGATWHLLLHGQR